MGICEILNCDSISLLSQLESDSVNCIITDPVYEQMPDINELIRISLGNVLVFSDARQRISNPMPHEILYWIKTPSTKNTVKNCSRFVEEILVYRKGPTFNHIHWSCMTGVFTDAVIDHPPLHPWQKPTSLLEKLIKIYSNPGDLIFDPFMGSGTTGVAAQQNKRNFWGMEIDPATFQVAQERLNVIASS